MLNNVNYLYNGVKKIKHLSYATDRKKLQQHKCSVNIVYTQRK